MKMKKRLPLLTLLCALCLPAWQLKAQPGIQAFAGNSGYNQYYSGQFIDGTSNYLFGGSTVEPFVTHSDAIIREVDPCFQSLFEGAFGGPNSNEVFYKVRHYINTNMPPIYQGPGDTYLGVGYTENLTTGERSAIVAAFEPDPFLPGVFSVLAQYTIGLNNGRREELFSVEPTSDNGFVVTGFVTDGNRNQDALVMKFDNNLQFQWSKLVGGTLGNDQGISVIQNQAGNVVVAGYATHPYPSAGLTTDGLLFELNVNTGEVVYSGSSPNIFIVSTGEVEKFFDVTEVNPGVYYLTGEYTDSASEDILFVELDIASASSGNPVLLHHYDDAGFTDYGYSLEFDANNPRDVFITGSHTPGPPSPGTPDPFFLKVDNTGNIDPAASFTTGDVDVDIWFEIDQEAASQTFLMSGFTRSFVAGPAQIVNYFWQTTDPTGSGGCTDPLQLTHQMEFPDFIVITDTAVGPVPVVSNFVVDAHDPSTFFNCNPNGCKRGDIKDVVAEESLSGLSLAPNPANHQLSIQSESSISSIRILDLNGRVLRRQNVENLGAEISVEGLSNGVYFAEVRLSNGSVHRIKWLKN